MTAVLRVWVMSPPSGLTVRAKKSAILGKSETLGAANSQLLNSAGSCVWGHREPVIAQNLGRIVLRVEADAQQLRAGQRRVRPQVFIDFRGSCCSRAGKNPGTGSACK